MKQVIVLDPEKLNGKLTAVLSLREPKNGEFVQLTDGKLEAVHGTGNVANVRMNRNWPTTWLYDVVTQ